MTMLVKMMMLYGMLKSGVGRGSRTMPGRCRRYGRIGIGSATDKDASDGWCNVKASVRS